MFDICEFMLAQMPEIPIDYQLSPIKRRLGIVSPSRRLVYFDIEYETKYAMWLCYKRRLNREGWYALYRRKRIKGRTKNE